MKKILLLTLLAAGIFITSKAQELTPGKSNHSFIEWNFGLAYLTEDFELDGPVFPGTSVLWGKTYINENNYILQFELGLAFPTLATAKIGVGKQFENSQFVVGVRPWPINFYLQPSFNHTEKGHWIASLEFNPYPNSILAFQSKAILNFGYRWNLNRK